MTIEMRPPMSQRDMQRVYALALAVPGASLHVVDLPYRLCSPSAQSLENVRLWEDAQGNLLGCAMAQLPWLTVDYAIHPAADDAGIEEAILAWAMERWPLFMAGHGLRYSLFVEVRADQPERIALLERLGFVRDEWHTLHLSQPLNDPIPSLQPPAGFTIRPLAGEEEAADYVALHRAAFGSENMTLDWRQRTLRAPQYIPELDLVGVAPDGRLAAFCICWLTQRSHDENGGNAGQVEPIGVHPDFQQRGLGRAILLEGLRRLKEHGALTVYVDSDGGNAPSRLLYASAGFRVAYQVLKYRKDF